MDRPFRLFLMLLLLPAATGCLSRSLSQTNREYAAPVREIDFRQGETVAYYQGTSRRYAPAGHFHYVLPELLDRPEGVQRPVLLYLPVEPAAGGPNAVALLLEAHQPEYSREEATRVALGLTDYFSGQVTPAAAPAPEPAGEDVTRPRSVRLYNDADPPTVENDPDYPPTVVPVFNPTTFRAAYRLPGGQAVTVDCQVELRWNVRSRFTYFWRQAACVGLIPVDVVLAIALVVLSG